MAQSKLMNKQRSKKDSLDESSIRILLKENEMLQTLFIHAENSTQSIFNSYLTLVTAIIGGVAIIWQFIASNSVQIWWAMFSISWLLVFIAISGSAYMSSLAIRYAHTIRYARGIDEIRRFLINHSKITTPPVYIKFLNVSIIEKTSWVGSIISVFIPIGTHQFFIAAVNSLAWAGSVYILLFISEVSNYRFARSAVLFLIIFAAYNIYSNLIIRRIISNLNVRVEI
jgi:hypothetical protein